MGKVVVLILFALGAQVNAKSFAEEAADILSERASNKIGGLSADLDDVAFAKGQGGGGAPAKRSPPSNTRDPGTGTFRAPKRSDFGLGIKYGTQKMIPADKEIWKDNVPPSFWGSKRAPGGPGKVRGTITYFKQDNTPKGREFGGMNRKISGEGKACQDEPAAPSWWGGGTGGTKQLGDSLGGVWNIKGRKSLGLDSTDDRPQGLRGGRGGGRNAIAEESQVTTPFKAPAPLAPRLGGARPLLRARPFL